MIKLSNLTELSLRDPRIVLLSDPGTANRQKRKQQVERAVNKLTSHSLMSVGEEPVMTWALLVAARAMQRKTAAIQRMFK